MASAERPTPRPHSLRESVAGGPNGEFKDHFSAQAANYAKFRPRYPRELFQYLGSIAPANGVAWDCATGSGQAAVELAEKFERVIATDASEKQVANAEPHPRVEYRVAPAERSGFTPQSVDLVTVAQALHWLDLDRFYAEVRLVLRPQGVIAAWAYKLAQIAPAIDEVVNHYYSQVVGEYWPAERLLVEKFEELPFAFNEIAAPPFEMTAEWKVELFLGYLRTWSATQRFMAAKERNPLEQIEEDLRSAWGDGQSRRVIWPLTVRVGRV